MKRFGATDRQQRRTGRAFTLVELLVVVAILALLVALLMPALQSARERAKGAACTSHERLAGSAFAGWVNDHQGYYPYINPEGMPLVDHTLPPCSCLTNGVNACTGIGINWDPTCPQSPCWPGAWQGSSCGIATGCWASVLAPYFGVSSWGAANYAPIMMCPLNPWPLSGWVPGAYWATTTYRMNGDMFPCSWRSGWGGVSYAGPGNAQGWFKAVNLNDINNPSAVMLLGEAAYDSSAINAWGSSLPQGNVPSIGCCYVTNYLYAASTPFCDNHFQGVAYLEVQVTPSKICNLMAAYFHDNAMNCLKVDGHVERMPIATLKSYAGQTMVNPPSPNLSPGGLFWADGKGSGWYQNQYPGAPWPYNR